MTTKAPQHTAIIYPETDGMPLPDGEFQAPIYREIVTTIESHFASYPKVRVNGDTFIYYQEGDPRRRIAPDCYVAFDIDMESIERNNTYLLWEIGKPPDFVLEIGSPSTARNDLTDKRDLYTRLGVPEYWRFDSTGGEFYGEPLVGEYLEDGEYRRLPLRREEDGMLWSHSDALNLDLCWDGGRLRLYDPVAGTWLLNRQEERAAKESAEARVAELEAELLRLRGK